VCILRVLNNSLHVIGLRYLYSILDVNDECDVLRGLEYATRLKSEGQVDVFIAAPCSLGEFCFEHHLNGVWGGQW